MKVSRITKLKDDESVLRIVRHYWIAYLLRGIMVFLLIGAPFFFMIPLMTMRIWGAVVFALSVFAGLLYAFRIGVIWYWNAFVITTHRLIDIDQRGLFDRTVSEAPYEKIQDVSYGVKGIWGTILKYGTLVVQTAGSTTNLELPFVKDPKDVHHLISETAARHNVRSQGGARSEKVAGLLDAAADLSDAEARAFLVAVQEAVTGGESEFSARPIEEVEDGVEEEKE